MAECKHEIDKSGVIEIDDVDLVWVECKHCDYEGTVEINVLDIDWEPRPPLSFEAPS